MDKLMSQKEVQRAQALDLLKNDKISQQEASKRIGVSTRQARRLAKRYQAEGLCGLAGQLSGPGACGCRLLRKTPLSLLINRFHRLNWPNIKHQKTAGWPFAVMSMI